MQGGLVSLSIFESLGSSRGAGHCRTSSSGVMSTLQYTFGSCIVGPGRARDIGQKLYMSGYGTSIYLKEKKSCLHSTLLCARIAVNRDDFSAEKPRTSYAVY